MSNDVRWNKGEEPVELELFQHAESTAAYLVSEDGNDLTADIWLAKSMGVVRGEQLPHIRGKVPRYTFTMTEGYATRKGLT